MAVSKDLFLLWAKTGQTPGQYHALPFHLIDVAACAEHLWRVQPATFQEKICSRVGLDPDDLRLLSVFLAASHDVGKCNRYFQAKSQDARTRLGAWNLALQAKEPFRHGQATNALLNHWLKKQHRWEQWSSGPISSAVGGHHGCFFADSSLHQLEVSDPPWIEMALALLNELEGVLGPLPRPPHKEALSTYVCWLSGFVSVADWLGSHEDMVLFQSEEGDLVNYLGQARKRAGELLKKLGIAAAKTTHALSITEYLPSGALPNSMQTCANQISSTELRFAIIEAPTGEGKTEASLCLAEPSRSMGRGLFVALPTMATANGLVGRIDQYLNKALGDASDRARLLHSGAWLYERPAKTIANPGDVIDSAETEDWFAGSKRGLLDHFGVGTIDQALEATLLTKHFFVRLFGLAGKTVIIDEVHAYDVYMSSLIKVLLPWLRALDCRVILLSATLPSTKRKALLESWGIQTVSQDCNYPRITVVDDQGQCRVESFEARKRKPLTIAPVFASEDDLIRYGLDRLVEALETGSQNAALIVNTVARAQRAYELASQSPTKDINISVFHARFTAKDRASAEQKTLDTMGKAADRSTRHLLIATQVVEQSLDLDFDAMVSDLAPIDLLIQRAGRLHRHPRSASGELLPADQVDQRQNPTLFVLIPDESEHGTATKKDRVYPAALLQITKEWIGTAQAIQTALHVAEAVEWVYGRVAQRDQEEGIADPNQALIEKLNESVKKQEHRAEIVTISLPDDRAVSLVRTQFQEDDESSNHALMAKTRLETLPSISLILWPDDMALPLPPLTSSAKRELALSIVRVSASGEVCDDLRTLIQLEILQPIRALRHCHLAMLSKEGTFETTSYRFNYSSKTGLSWVKKDA